VVNDDLAGKTLREKCVKGDTLRMVSHLDDLQEIWDTLDTCFERPEKYMEEVLRREVCKEKGPLSYTPSLLLYTITLPTASLLRTPYPLLK
jgi:hypothetical protein